MPKTMKVPDPVHQAVKEYAEDKDMSQKDALARMLAEAGYNV